ncbi:protein kinase [Nitriliruptoraceae bacterium ZYF776]|nr:protein kinase [Profundirhabdus halotolerans]
MGRYRLVGVSGTGTFATVHRAEDERLGDTVALKILAENHSLDGEVRERFLREGRALRRIDSDHVVAVHDLGETDRQQPYLVMQHADRGTLAERVRARRSAGWRASREDVRTVARSLADAVAAVHRADIVHRDLSPNNVLLRSLPGASGAVEAVPEGPLIAQDERLLLADLGLCKDLARHSGLTAAGGTEGFRPPEQRGAPGYVSPAADLWSLSALVVWLVTGRAPDDEDVTARIVAAGLPTALGGALAAALVADPARRPADAAAWFAAIDGALGPVEGDPSAALLAEPIPTSLPPGAAAAASTVPATTPAGVGSTVPSSSLPPTQPPPGFDPAPAPRWWHRRATTTVAAALIALTVGTATGLLLAGGDAGLRTTALGEDDVLVEREAGDASLAIAGPREVPVGTSATFLADATEVPAWAWVAPDGTVSTGDRLTVDTASAGRATITLVGRGPDGQLLTVTHDLQVVAD